MPILLVEDDQDLAALWREYLISKGLPTEVRHTVAEARKAISELELDLLIVDYTLPDGTAEDVLAAVRASGTAAKVILCSGHGYDLPDAVLDQVYVLAKPFRLDALEAAIRALRP